MVWCLAKESTSYTATVHHYYKTAATYHIEQTSPLWKIILINFKVPFVAKHL